MKYLYMDESGDLGFDLAKKNTSKFFVVSLIIADNQRDLDRIVKKTRRVISKNNPPAELHASKESIRVRRKLLTLLADEETVRIVSLIVEKDKVAEAACLNTHQLYTDITIQILKSAGLSETDKFDLKAERRESKKLLNQKFRYEVLSAFPYAEIEVRRPHEFKGLQVADFVANATWQNFEHNDKELYNIIKDKTLAAFPGNRPDPLRQGNYLSESSLSKARDNVKRSLRAKSNHGKISEKEAK